MQTRGWMRRECSNPDCGCEHFRAVIVLETKSEEEAEAAIDELRRNRPGEGKAFRAKRLASRLIELTDSRPASNKENAA